MVTKKVIRSLYRQFDRPPKSIDELNLGLLFDYAVENHGIFLDETHLYIGSVDPKSPFAMLPLKRIHEIVEFDKVIAIILPAAILFLNKEDSDVNVHLRMDSEEDRVSVWDRVRALFSRESESENSSAVCG